MKKDRIGISYLATICSLGDAKSTLTRKEHITS